MPRHPGSYSSEFRRNQKILLNGPLICHLCGHDGARQVDHLVPRKYGGGDEISNLALAHGHDDRTGRSGIDYRCHECWPPRSCNQSRKIVRVELSYRSRDW